MGKTLEEMRVELREKQKMIDIRPRNSILVLQAMIARVEGAFQDFNREARTLGYAPQDRYIYGSLGRRANRSIGKEITRLLVDTKKLLAVSNSPDRG